MADKQDIGYNGFFKSSQSCYPVRKGNSYTINLRIRKNNCQGQQKNRNSSQYAIANTEKLGCKVAVVCKTC